MRRGHNYWYCPPDPQSKASRAPRISAEFAKKVDRNLPFARGLLRSANDLPARLTAIYAVVSVQLGADAPFKGNEIRAEKYMQAAVAGWIYDRIDEDISSRNYLLVVRSFVVATGIRRLDWLCGVGHRYLQGLAEHWAETHSPRTVNQHLQVLRSLFGWLVDQGLMARSPYRRQQLRQVDRRRLYHPNRIGGVRRTLTRGQGQHVINWAAAQPPEKGCAITLMLCLGLRLSEVVGIQRENLYEQDGQRWVTIHGKGKRTRTLYLDAPSCAAVDRVLAMRDGPGRPAIRGPLLRKEGEGYSPKTAAKWVREVGIEIGRPDLTPHQLRYTLATLLGDDDVDLREVQGVLGHADIRTTAEIYDQGDRRYVGGSGFSAPNNERVAS